MTHTLNVNVAMGAVLEKTVDAGRPAGHLNLDDRVEDDIKIVLEMFFSQIMIYRMYRNVDVYIYIYIYIYTQ